MAAKLDFNADLPFVRPYAQESKSGYSVGVVLQECKCEGGVCHHRVSLVHYSTSGDAFYQATDAVRAIRAGAFMSTHGVIKGNVVRLRYGS